MDPNKLDITNLIVLAESEKPDGLKENNFLH